MELIFICLHPLNTIGFWFDIIHNALDNLVMILNHPLISCLTKINDLSIVKVEVLIKYDSLWFFYSQSIFFDLILRHKGNIIKDVF